MVLIKSLFALSAENVISEEIEYTDDMLTTECHNIIKILKDNDMSWDNVLGYGCRIDDKHVVNMAIENGADPLDDKNLCAKYASEQGNIEMVKFLESRYNIPITFENSVRPAVKRGQLEMLKYFVATSGILDDLSYSYVYAEDPEKYRWVYVLKDAVSYGHVHIVEFIVSHNTVFKWWGPNKTGEYISICDEMLTIASVKGYLEMVKYLVEKCNSSITEVIFKKAIANGHLDICKYFIERCGTNFFNIDRMVKCAIHYNKIYVAEYLVKECGGKVDKDSIWELRYTFIYYLSFMNGGTGSGASSTLITDEEKAPYEILPIVKFVFENFKYDNDNIKYFFLEVIISLGRLEVVEYIYNLYNGSDCIGGSDRCITFSVIGNKIDIVEFLLEKKCGVVSNKHFQDAYKNSRWDMISVLMKYSQIPNDILKNIQEQHQGLSRILESVNER
jgi:hypothetical protein